MMSVLEYALDINKNVNEVITLCKKLGIKVSSENDILEDEDIILLDNEIANETPLDNEAQENEDKQEEIEETMEEFTDSYYDELEPVEDIHKETTKKHSKKNKTNKKGTPKEYKDKKEFQDKKKEMYKNKEKLKTNDIQNENIILYKEGMTVSDLALSLNISVSEIIKKLFALGIMMTINSKIDFDSAEIITAEYKKELKKEETTDVTNFEQFVIIDDPKDLKERPPVVTIMGHVDHGKTTLLDTIRKTDVASGEAGGITQAISAYQINYKDKKITFIDTPGHAAFTEMRARGASITDIIIIIVAADDGVMPQTKEVIDHAKAAGVPIIVAVNKMDKENANAEKVMTEMANNGINPEAWGGDYMFVNISAKTGMGIEDLLDRILLIAELQELKANPDRYASGTVIESKIDKNLGVVSTILIQNGTLRLGDSIVAGPSHGRISTLKDHRGIDLVEA